MKPPSILRWQGQLAWYLGGIEEGIWGVRTVESPLKFCKLMAHDKTRFFLLSPHFWAVREVGWYRLSLGLGQGGAIKALVHLMCMYDSLPNNSKSCGLNANYNLYPLTSTWAGTPELIAHKKQMKVMSLKTAKCDSIPKEPEQPSTGTNLPYPDLCVRGNPRHNKRAKPWWQCCSQTSMYEREKGWEWRPI